MNNDKTLKEKRDSLIIRLWLTLKDMRELPGSVVTNEDQKLWELIASHNAIKEAIKHSFKKVPRDRPGDKTP